MDVNYQDEAYLDNANTREADARTLLNGKFGYEQESWQAYLWATNITDEEYITVSYEPDPAVGIQDYDTPGAPRMIGASVSVNF